jgi:hypothetical protein
MELYVKIKQTVAIIGDKYMCLSIRNKFRSFVKKMEQSRHCDSMLK